MATDLAVFRSRCTVDENGCWNWGGTIVSGGYPQVQIARKKHQVHRLTYQLAVGPIDDGMTLDHLCRNRKCINPDHLEQVTNHANVLRGLVPSANRSICKNGRHDITAADAIYVDSEGTERCRECRRESKRRYQERKLTASTV